MVLIGVRGGLERIMMAYDWSLWSFSFSSSSSELLCPTVTMSLIVSVLLRFNTGLLPREKWEETMKAMMIRDKQKRKIRRSIPDVRR